MAKYQECHLCRFRSDCDRCVKHDATHTNFFETAFSTYKEQLVAPYMQTIAAKYIPHISHSVQWGPIQLYGKTLDTDATPKV